MLMVNKLNLEIIQKNIYISYFKLLKSNKNLVIIVAIIK